MLKRTQPRKAPEAANGFGVLSVPGQAPNAEIFELMGRGFRHDACPAMFESTNEDGSPTGLLDDPLGSFAALGFEGGTIEEAQAFLCTIPASDKATPEEIQAAIDRHFKVLR